MSGYIIDTIIAQYDEMYAPPEQDCLRLSVVGDQVFLAIGAYEETSERTSFTVAKQASVRWNDLLPALIAGQISASRGASDTNTREDR